MALLSSIPPLLLREGEACNGYQPTLAPHVTAGLSAFSPTGTWQGSPARERNPKAMEPEIALTPIVRGATWWPYYICVHMCRVSRSGPRQLSLCGPYRPRLVSSVGLLWYHWPLQLPQFYFPLKDNIRGKKKVMTTNWFDGFLLKIASNDGSEEIYLLMRVEIFPLADLWGHGPRTSSESTHQILSRLEFSLDWLANSFLSHRAETQKSALITPANYFDAC